MAEDIGRIDSLEGLEDGAQRKQALEDQEEAAWNEICNGFIKTVYSAREQYSKTLLQADEDQRIAQAKADGKLSASLDPATSHVIAYAGSQHALAVHKIELAYTRANVTAATQFKNDVEAASMYLSQRAINIVSAGNQ